MVKKLWGKEEEREFFSEKLRKHKPEELFYKTDNGRYLAYWPKGYKGHKSTLQTRNAFIGEYTEEWVAGLLEPLANKFNAHADLHVYCDEIGINKKSRSPVDVAIVKSKERTKEKTKEKNYKPKNILLLVEVKMSIVWNWEYDPKNGELKCIGDYTTHQGNPGLLRSDTMLKAIGKSINIRVSGPKSSQMPIVVIGNTPIREAYYEKVDYLKKAGIIQGFYSVNPEPLDNHKSNKKSTKAKGFIRIDRVEDLYSDIKEIVNEKKEYFSAMLTRNELGKLIEAADKALSYEAKAEKFLEMIRGV